MSEPELPADLVRPLSITRKKVDLATVKIVVTNKTDYGLVVTPMFKTQGDSLAEVEILITPK